MKKVLLGVGITLGVILFLFVALVLFVDDDEETFSKFNSGNDTYTLMVYICGADLESEEGAATSDIDEMLKANIDEKLNILLCTGGASSWQNNYGISSSATQIYKINSLNNLELLKEFDGKRDMTDPNTLYEFINYGINNFNTNKYGLIMWDHGGGAISGYGYDENANDPEETITISELKSVLDKFDKKFDFIGFDACLMANVETAYSLRDKANFLIASEETEPGSGWEYTSLINKISSNTSENAGNIGKVIVDRFIKENNDFSNFEEATLSVIDLSKINDLYSSLVEFIKGIKLERLDKNDFSYISKAIANSKAYANGEIDTFDLVNFAEKINNSETQNLISKVKEAIYYNKNTDLVENSNGMSIYIPYSDLSYYDKMISIYNDIGISKEYIDVLSEIGNYIANGKIETLTINNTSYNIDEDYSEYSWYDDGFYSAHEDYYNNNSYDSEELEIEEENGNYVLKLSEDDWDVINNITCEVMIDDGEGYIDLGSDDYYETDNNGNLIVDFDGTWISINGYIVPYYAISDSKDVYMGKVPAYLNDQFVNIIIAWYEDSAKILGAQKVDAYGDTTINYKGLKQISKGDKIEFVFDYYKYNGEFDDSYTLYDPLVVDDSGLKVEYSAFDDNTKFYVYYKITDIYNNEYYTEAITIN